MTALELAIGLSGKQSLPALFGSVCLAFAPTQLPLGILEGVLTAGALAFVYRHRPKLLTRLRVMPAVTTCQHEAQQAERAARGWADCSRWLHLDPGWCATWLPLAEWPGVDESVIGNIAHSAGRPESQPLLSWVQGDLLLFMFLVAGLAAGFVLGYFARVAFVEQREPSSETLDEHAT